MLFLEIYHYEMRSGVSAENDSRQEQGEKNAFIWRQSCRLPAQ